MSSKDRVSQIIKALVAVVALIALTGRFGVMRRLKNSKPRMIGVCEGVRAKSTSM
jgi:hypothetical protein